jgi:hypothetical protein
MRFETPKTWRNVLEKYVVEAWESSERLDRRSLGRLVKN